MKCNVLITVLCSSILFSAHAYSETKDDNNIFAIVESKKVGFINKKGSSVITEKYNDCRPFKEGLAGVYYESKWGFIDADGNFVIKPKFDYVNDFKEGFASVEFEGKWGFID